ncbi:acylneuraminate cytidylyltransferase family protein [Cytobacillus oceanisediminis]|uniref:acylneuraminate cytidylyltransferase family protein n=1 Tax=Cytobacillus oceanisediminis TaxID=665099 RepID=UPI001D159110|nr:acylneuraminate cytidylyltransferase family protein [Cytobacillus oceanisediminis]MCC3646344.1 acylneuraminate cytidylyltransferase family protein [Cytobacillus oceanisediminis]
MKILAVICARGGSKGVPNKNIRLINGKPLIAYTIEMAMEYTNFDRVIVSTDSPDIAKIAEQYGAEVPFLRPKELSLDTSPKIPVLQHAVNFLHEHENEKYDLIVDLDPTSPLRIVQDIDNCINKMHKYKPNIVFSVTKAKKNPYFNMVEEKDGKVFLSKQLNHPVTRRQDAPAVFELNASIYVYKTDFLLSTNTIFSDNSMAVEMPEYRSIDIDRPIDFEFIEFLMRKGEENGKH